jgi:hypothetical protein
MCDDRRGQKCRGGEWEGQQMGDAVVTKELLRDDFGRFQPMVS